MTTPDDGSYDPSVHLSYGDIAVDTPRGPTFLRDTIKQSKTNPFCKGVDLFIGCHTLSKASHHGSSVGLDQIQASTAISTKPD